MPELNKNWRDYYSEATVTEVWTVLRKRYDHINEDVAQEVMLRVFEYCPLDPQHYALNIAPKVLLELTNPDMKKNDDHETRRTRREIPMGLAVDYAAHVPDPTAETLDLEEELVRREQEVLWNLYGGTRKAECHPEQDHYSYGKCLACYKRDRRRV